MPHIRYWPASIAAFLNGIREYRTDFTTHYDDYGLLERYDCGRALARRVVYGRNKNGELI